MKPLIAIVEDEPDIAKLISINLEKSGYRTQIFPDGDSFLKTLKNSPPHLAILDLMLPDIDGLEICKYLRNNKDLKSCKIIIVTAKGDEIDKVLGLELGADDYVTKPFSPIELTARVKAVLRRGNDEEREGIYFIKDDVEIDEEKFIVKVKGKKIELTTTEFKILLLLAKNKGRVFSRQQILDNLWGDDKVVVDRTVDVHIRHLREKLGRASKFIKNIRGVGYKLEE
ncbi:MAG: DNA-binding response regulator [Candidatus Schekmanbacteria bacterium]|nr:MAG: DNA-binding response regulator [Candidatus Schekmanbacteria bacterium]